MRQTLHKVPVEDGFSALESFPQPHSPETHPVALLESGIIQN